MSPGSGVSGAVHNELLSRLLVFLDACTPCSPLLDFVANAVDQSSAPDQASMLLLNQCIKEGATLELDPKSPPEKVFSVFLYFLRAGPSLLPMFNQVLLTVNCSNDEIRRACVRSCVESLAEFVCGDFLQLLSKWISESVGKDNNEERAKILHLLAPFILRPHDSGTLSSQGQESNVERVIDDLITSFILEESGEIPQTSVERN